MAPNKYLTEIKPGIYKTKGLSSSTGRLDFSELANKISNPLNGINYKDKKYRPRSSNNRKRSPNCHTSF